MDYLHFDKMEISCLKRRYNKAVKNNAEMFVFQGKQLMTAYAKYLIQYLDSPSTKRRYEQD